MVNVKIKVKEGAKVPQYETEGASGVDVRAHIDEELVLEPGSIELIPTGLFVEIPKGYEIQVRSRSGLSLKHGIVVLNSPGTVDSDYRGEIKLILMNHSKVPFRIENGMRLAQCVLCKVEMATFVLEEDLTLTEREKSGFGSTGVA